MKNDNRPRAYRKDTLLTHLGRNPEAQHGAINPPVYHASMILSKNIAEWENRPDPRTHFGVVRYGLSGTPTTFALEELLAKVEGGYRAAIVCSGLAAITAPLQGLLQQGDHLLMVDSTYGPARNFCNRVLTRMGVETTYYDPLIGDGIAQLMRPNTKVVYVESPGSLTFEVQDVPAIAAVAHRHGAKGGMENTWPTPYLFRSFEHGVDGSLHAATKYISGNGDRMLGAALAARGLLGIVLTPAPNAAVDAFIDSLDLFGIGASWGGYESLIQPPYPERSRTATRWQAEGPLVRIHIGLEDPHDLIADLAQ